MLVIRATDHYENYHQYCDSVRFNELGTSELGIFESSDQSNVGPWSEVRARLSTISILLYPLVNGF